MNAVRRIYVEKKEPYAVKAKELKEDLKSFLGIKELDNIRIFIRYDVENVSDKVFKKACEIVFSEPPVDILYHEKIEMKEQERAFSVEFLPGQFDQRADSAVQCIRFLNEQENPTIRTAVTYLLDGRITEEEFEKIKNYCINPVDSRLTGATKPDTLELDYKEPKDVIIFDGFIQLNEKELELLYQSLNLAMTSKDFEHIQKYFKTENRNPSMTEIRVLDTYWSDHCRHTTFSTELKNIFFEDGYYHVPMKQSYQNYLETREEIFDGRKDKFICLMDLALLAMRKLKKDGKLEDMEESDEINACSIVVPVEMERNGKKEIEEWLISFKNETHNHPTEIEPFGGAATCLGGAIRDPLSGRAYVYQAMRITGAADPTKSVSETLKGKLPQKKLVRGAATGYSSYGNQIGLATGLVKEIYHPNYVAKRMEIGAVMGAAPRKNVIRENSDPGDRIILLGGQTGRDGCGGATGSSKVHTEESIETCGAEVQKGNAPTERKIQRLFRREEVSRLIKKCNDFGAGGVSVAIGELADGLIVDMDKVPKKYAGLDGTELAISESQERMAVVVDSKDVKQFLCYAAEENLEAIEVAIVTEEKRLILKWREKEIVNIKREFLDTNGAHQEADVQIEMPLKADDYFAKYANNIVEKSLKEGRIRDAWLSSVSDLNTCSQKGLVEMFDSSIGAGSVVMPYGGKYQKTETQAMIAKIPVLDGNTDVITLMSHGFDPFLSSWSPYHGAIYAITESMSKIVAAGGEYKKIRFTFQEYFRRMSKDPSRWSQPFAALLGAFDAQMGYGLPSIGGKDSMSGTFNEIDVPPTLVSFAVNVSKLSKVVTTELKKPGNVLIKFDIPKNEYQLPDYKKTMQMFETIQTLNDTGDILSAFVLDANGIVPAISKMAFGNALGVIVSEQLDSHQLFKNETANIIVEISEDVMKQISIPYEYVGMVTEKDVFIYKENEISIEEVENAWKHPLEKVFPTKSTMDKRKIESQLYEPKEIYICQQKIAKPNVFIPVFPGTNCEYDSMKAFEEAGANVTTRIFKNLTATDIRESVRIFEQDIKNTQIIMFPGGFSAGDEPDGSAKFFATAFQNEMLKEAVMDMLQKRDGLALGICNGFQALIKLGLVPNGKISSQKETDPTLTFNTINRHISKMVYTKVVSKKSPWLQETELGATYVNPASHGEGRFVATKEWLDKLFVNGQVATQYCDIEGNISMNEEWNVNGSYQAIEGITSPDGRCFGKMAHVERFGNGVARNIYGEQDLKIFKAGVSYFK